MNRTVKRRKGGKNAFGATSPPFIDYLKEILRRYPDGGQILKELIQNADDGQASEVVLIHDERTYGTHSVWTEALGKFQGPALYAYNNAAFSEEDWEGIQQAGRSIKQDDPTKVGRFGIGFNSVYHVTDLPCVFSSKHLAVFDPQKMMFDEEREGYRWSLEDEEDKDHLAKYTDQFKPFQDIVSLVFSCSWDEIIRGEYFKGTLFRFPLRNEPSEISDNLYNAKKVTQLFDSFIADVDISLLFLRKVSSISLLHIDTNGTVNVRMKVSVSSSSPLQECGMLDFQREYVEGTTSFKTVSCNSPSKEETKTKWLVTACHLKEGCVPEIDTLAVKMSFHPQVDVAFQCDQNGTHAAGGLSCFLPLPNNEANKTGLPVHINACFGLTDNRRYIKWQEVDQKNDEAAMWNELLVKEVLPHVYLMIIHDAIQLARKSKLPASTVYNLWPDLSKTKHRVRWHEVAMVFFKWLLQGKEVFYLAENETSWVGISDAVFLNGTVDACTMSAVAQLLISEGENLVTVPEHVLKAIERTFPEAGKLHWVTPCLVRTVLCRSELGRLCKGDKLSLLEYVLRDGNYKELHGLQLLPLSDGRFRSFTNEEDDTALIDSEEFPRVLLPFCKERFLPDDLKCSTIQHIRQMAVKNPDLYALINLDAKNVATLAKKHLPRDWKEGQGHVKWNSGKQDHPPKTWLTEFWKFLNTHWDELKEFIGMPLIPLEPLQKTGSCTLLARLEKNSTLIFQSSRESSLSDQIQKVLQTVGGTIIKKDECLKHHDIENYVLLTSPKNVLQVLLNCNGDKVISGITSASLHEKEELKTYLSSLESLSEAEQNLLLALPIFRLMSGKYVAVQSKQAVILKSNPSIPHDLPVPETIVQCANEADRRLLTLLKVDLLDAAQLAFQLVNCIEKMYFSNEDEEKVMTWILTHGNILFSQSGELLGKSKNLSFIKTEQGERKQPSSVFDPTNKVFQDLFEEDFFPLPVYRTPLMLQSLKHLGLQIKEEQISSKALLHVASQIQKLHVHSRNKAFKKADVLVKVLNRNDLLSNFSDKERRELIQMQWVPCENPNTLNMKGNQKRGLYKPSEIRASKYSPIVGHVMPLTVELSEGVCEKLNLLTPPPAEKVMENLCVLGSMAPIMANPDSDYEFKNKLHSTYKFMQENIEYFRGEINKKCIAWLWCQNEFVSPRDVVLFYPPELDLSLYIKKVPHEFLPYAKLLKEFGVKESLMHEEIEDIFHDIKQSIDDRDPPFGEASELKVSIAILDWMRKNEMPLSGSTPVPVRAPNQNFTLQPLKNTVFCDISDEGLDDLRQDQEEFHVIHEEVLSVTAKWLKIPLLSTRILKPQFIRVEEECPGIEQCGQAEPITQRIKNILKEYDEESDIFKELIQNAEDSGARTCGFLLDFRVHLPESLIDDGMALCNGPCLWAFNDKLFSEEDWKNIVRIGSNSKGNKIEKIGHFGLGFNAVYHVTDIPSILSGKCLLILDPNVTHLEKHIHSKANPGIKLDLFQERLFRRFPGQFKPYQGIFDCDLSRANHTYYNGTLIKLPFRTAEEALKSEISSKVYDKERINAFQEHFTSDSQTPLLFLQNITSVPFQIISDDAFTPPLQEQIQTLFKITREVVCSINISNESHLQEIRDTLENLDMSFHKIVDCFTAHIDKIIHEHAGTSSSQYWLLYSCLGSKDSMRMFQRELQELKFSLPVGGVAVPLQRESENVWSPDESCEVGQAFCFLPLPIETGLPVHINGSFAVTSNRKALWESGTKKEWNKALLQDAAATAYITTLLELKNLAQNGNLQNYAYCTFWPDGEKVGKAFQPLVHAIYSAVAQNTKEGSLKLFSNGQTWCSINNARFLDPNIEGNEAVGDIALKVFLNDTDSGYCAVPLPSWVRNSFIRCGFSEVIKEKTFHWVEFYQMVFKNLKNMDAHCRNCLILNAIDMNDQAVDELLKSNPCIPTQKAGTLQFISKLVNPHGKVACLYEPEEGRFLDDGQNDYFTPKRIQRLLGLGMLSDVLTLEEVVERAKTISRVWDQDKMKAQRHLQCLFDCMKGCSHGVDSPYWEILAHVSFLPGQIIDQDNSNTSVLKKPSDVYSYRCYNLVNMIEFTVDHSVLHIQPDDPLLTKLRVNKSPPVETVLKQLKEVYDHSDAIEKSELLSVAKSCYDYLNKYLLDDGDPTDIIKHAQSIPFVFIEDRFVNVRSVAKTQEFEGKPYLYVLPPIFSKFEKLWHCVGIKERFTADQFTAVLEEMSTVPGPLSNSDLHICHIIVTKGLYESKEGKVKDCLLPDERGVLTYASELNFNDSPWMPQQAELNFCHKLISRSVACYFGVNTTRHHTLKNHEVAGFSPFAKEFGQREKLTLRIKNIIEAYPAKKDILKELIQNADDAGATEIHFVWDKRVHNTTKIFGDKWELLQGPALCVYNNSKFSDEDLQGIQHLGEGGKRGTLGRTGKYGIGFNSVYQLTDCPSVLSGDEYLCIFDPNLKYVESSTQESPGCMYSMEEKFKESFKDVYHTFLPDKFDLNSGTIFRLPLRTEKMADLSEISKHVVEDYEMNELSQTLTKDPEGLILFLKHITKIQFHEISTNGREQNYFLVEKNVSENNIQERECFHNDVQNCLRSGNVIPCQAVYNVQISYGEKHSQWVVAEEYGSFTQSHETEDHSNRKVSQVALAACVDKKAVGNEFHGRVFCALPLPIETGLPIHVNGNFEVDFSRRDLWKEDAESLKTEWNQSLKLNSIAPLYADLLTFLCATFKQDKPSCLYSLHHLNSHFRYFPTVSKLVSPVWHKMISEVYKSIHKRNLPVIPVLRCEDHSHLSGPKYRVDWSSLSKPDSMDSPHFTTSTNNDLFDILESIGMKIVPPTWKILEVKESFKTAGVEVVEVTPLSVISYLKKKPLNNPLQTDDDLPLAINQTLLKDAQSCSKILDFCIMTEDNNSSSVDLNGLPLLLTQDQMLRKFNSDSPKLMSKFSKMFHGHEAEFADFCVNSKHIKIFQEGKYIEKLSIPIAAKILKPILQQLLEESLYNETNGLYTASTPMITWLKTLWNFFKDQLKDDSQGKDKGQAFSEVKTHFLDSPILPVICPSQNKCFLQTIRNLQSVVLDCQESISPSLIKLGFMGIDHTFFQGFHLFLHNYVEPELLNIRDTTSVLKQLYHVHDSQFEMLSGEETDVLQHYLQSGISFSKNTDEYKRMLKSLPLFETISGKRQRINLHRNVFILQAEFKGSFPDLYILDDSNTVFLKDTSINKNLSQDLNIPVLEDLEYCVQFMLPNVQSLTETQLLGLLKLIVKLREKCSYKNYQDTIASKLRDVQLIRDVHGYLQKVSYYFDDKVDIYKVMLLKERFVPKEFWELFKDSSAQAKCLLKEVGLKHKVSVKEIIEFALQIESESGAGGNTELQVLKCRSLTLLKTILSDEKKYKILHRIATIKFIFPMQTESRLHDYHKPFAEEREVVAIKGSLLEKNPGHQSLIWTAMPILPSKGYSQKQLDALRSAGAFDEPLSEHIMQNLKNICRSQCKTPMLIDTRAKVFTTSYAYLQTIDFNAPELVDLPLVLIENDTNLVKASQAVFTLPNYLEFRPYLYVIQVKHVMYAEFFKKVGVKEKASATQLCTILQEIYSETVDKKTLQPNQQRTVQRAVQQLFGLIKDEPKAHFCDNALYLPSTDGKLYESHTLFFNDTVFQANRLETSLETKLKLLVKLYQCHLEKDPFEHQKLLQLLPQGIRPKFLSQVISESLAGVQVDHCDYGKACNFSGWFEKHLSSREFLHGLICLIREQSDGTISQTDAARMCQRAFGKIQIVCCRSLKTELLLNQEPLEGTKVETQIYVEKQEDGCIFYLKHNNNMAPKVVTEVNLYLTKEINGLLKNMLNSLSLPVLGQLLLCENMEDVERALQQNGILNSVSDEEGLCSCLIPGSPVPEEWYDSLDMHPLNSFQKGEYVAFRKDESKMEYFFAIVVECVNVWSGSGRQIPSRYKVQVGNDEWTEVSSLDLYQFKREKQSSALATNGTCTEIDIMPECIPSRERPLPQNLEEAKRDIDQILKEILNMSNEDKRKAIRRLYLRWHPDKNLDNTDLANEAFKYLLNKIDEGERGSTEPNTSSNWNDFTDYYTSWDNEARSHRRGREQFYQNNSRCRYNFWSYYRETPKPDIEEANRWHRQAQCDLASAHSEAGDSGSPEWCLFKVHQAVQKALIATEYRRNGQHPCSLSIASLAQRVSRYGTCLSDFPSAVTQLRALGVDADKTQYPNHHPLPHIPNEQFKSDDAKRAVDIAAELLQRLQRFIAE